MPNEKLKEYIECLKNKDDAAIHEIDLSNEHIQDADLENLSPYLHKVWSLDLKNNQISAAGIKILAPYLKYSKLFRLNLCGNKISDEGIEVLAPYLKGSKIRQLGLSFNRISDKGIKILACYLKDTEINDLYLRGNLLIGVEGVKALALSLKKSKISILDIGINPIGDEGIRILASYLKDSSLSKLFLANTQLSKVGILTLAAHLKDSSISTLILFGTSPVDYFFDIRITQATFLMNSFITGFSQWENTIDDECIKVLSAVLMDTAITREATCDLDTQSDLFPPRAVLDQVKWPTSLSYNKWEKNPNWLQWSKTVVSILQKHPTMRYSWIGGETLLHVAAIAGDADLIRLILSGMPTYRANVWLQLRSGSWQTAADLAKENNNLDCLPLLTLQASAKTPSWYFDKETEINLSSNSNDDYILLPATSNDVTHVMNHYQHHPIPGMDIKQIQVIYNPTLTQSFATRLKLLQGRNGNPAFTPKWSDQCLSLEEKQQRTQVMQYWQRLSTPYTDDDYPAVQLLPCWHGTKTTVLSSVFTTGYVNLATTDTGYFGKGIYSAHEAEYAYRVYGQSGVLIMNWVATFSAYPVVDGDMLLLRGKGNYQNYDMHLALVAPANPNNPNEVSYLPFKFNQPHVYTEVVVFESSQCLPRFLIELQPSFPKAPPSLPTSGGNPNALFKSDKKQNIHEKIAPCLEIHHVI